LLVSSWNLVCLTGVFARVIALFFDALYRSKPLRISSLAATDPASRKRGTAFAHVVASGQ
jgi:hypothetical protein